MYLLLHEETLRHFVMRCRVGFTKEVQQLVRSRKSSTIVELRPTETAIATVRGHGYIVRGLTTIKVRMVKVKLPGGEVEILLTGLYDVRRLTLADLRYLYGLRWGIETTYNKQNNQQQMEPFSGLRVLCIQQHYAAAIFVANLQSLIEKQCEACVQKLSTRRQHRYRINRNTSWAALKHNMAKVFLHHPPREILVQLQQAVERNLEPLRPARQYPRLRKAKPLNAKYQSLTNYKRAI